MSILISALIVFAGAYVFLAAFAWLSADRIVFQSHPSSYTTLPGMLQIPATDGTPITAVYLPNAAAMFTILHLHGNAEDLGDGFDHLAAIRDHGFSVVSMDYRSYGTTPGRPNEGSVHADVASVCRHMVGQLHIPLHRILVYGFSLGGGPAVELAIRQRVAGLVLQSAFVSAYRVITGVPLLPGDRFRNLAKIGQVQCPVLVIHGDRDGTIPFRHGHRLFVAAREPRRSLWVQGATHTNLVDVAGERYWDALAEFADLVPRG